MFYHTHVVVLPLSRSNVDSLKLIGWAQYINASLLVLF